MPRLTVLSLYHRGSADEQPSPQRRMRGYHWGMLIMPVKQSGNDTLAASATDRSYMDYELFRLVNPGMDWWLEFREVDPYKSTKLVAMLVIGVVPDGVTDEEIKAFFDAVPLPVRNRDPQESCSTWLRRALEGMQANGWAEPCAWDKVRADAVEFADFMSHAEQIGKNKLKYYVDVSSKLGGNEAASQLP